MKIFCASMMAWTRKCVFKSRLIWIGRKHSNWKWVSWIYWDRHDGILHPPHILCTPVCTILLFTTLAIHAMCCYTSQINNSIVLARGGIDFWHGQIYKAYLTLSTPLPIGCIFSRESDSTFTNVHPSVHSFVRSSILRTKPLKLLNTKPL